MKYLDEFRDRSRVQAILKEIKAVTTSSWNLMEICGGQTHSIIKHGIDQLLPQSINLIHGPGCPVCVTPLELIDSALEIAEHNDVIFTSFGDMLRVPGSYKNLFQIKSEGADIRIIYSPLDAIRIARENKNKKVVFFGIGFETTAPATAMTVVQAARENLDNFFLLTSHVLVPPAMQTLLDSPRNLIQGFLAAGHVCAVMGARQYEPIVNRYNIPIVITGFEPVDLLCGILSSIKQLENGKSFVENQYERVVDWEGNLKAQEVLAEVFTICDRKWRGIGTIRQSGWKLSDKYARFDATIHFDLGEIIVNEPENCQSGEILQGLKKPPECPAFGKECTPMNPLGATMVSSEGACAAYYSYHRFGDCLIPTTDEGIQK